MIRLTVAVILAWVPACGGDDNASDPVDAGRDTAGNPDADAGTEDATDPDTSPDDTGDGDMGQPDVDEPDADVPNSVEVTTSAGTLRGEMLEGTARFRGIPYAAPPTGELRFRPPAPALAWDGVRDALAFGPQCPQRDILKPNDPVKGDEDCLTVNVWTPEMMPDEPRPVMVWFHGGAFVAGTAGASIYDGAKLASHGVVVVTVNYRLDTLGFLAHPALTEEGGGTSGNYGLRDQQAALRWVRDNIGAFGGDADQVTIFGESAGGHSVCAHMVASQGLFHRAISQSGLCSIRLDDLATAEALGTEMAQASGCADAEDTLACLRAAPLDDVVPVLDPRAVPGGLLTHPLPFKTIVDGTVLTQSPGAAFAGGRVPPVPFLSGTTADEANLFHVILLSTAVSNEAEYRAAVEVRFGDDTDAVLAAYPIADFDDADAALNRVTTDGLFACPARRAARQVAGQVGGNPGTYLYVFDADAEGVAIPNLGAFHGSELTYVWGNSNGLFGNPGAAGQPLSEAMQRYWTRFAMTGDPNGGDDVAWPVYDADSDELLRLSVTSSAQSGYLSDRCNFWDSLED